MKGLTGHGVGILAMMAASKAEIENDLPIYEREFAEGPFKARANAKQGRPFDPSRAKVKAARKQARAQRKGRAR